MCSPRLDAAYLARPLQTSIFLRQIFFFPRLFVVSDDTDMIYTNTQFAVIAHTAQLTDLRKFQTLLEAPGSYIYVYPGE